MKKSNLKTFRAIMLKDKIRAKDLAQLVKINGTLYRNSWGEWEAALPGNSDTKNVIDAALKDLRDFVSAEVNRDSMYLEECYDSSIHHTLDNYGFNIGKDDKLCVEKTPVQTQDELIERLQSDLASANEQITHLEVQLEEASSWTGFDDVDEDLIPKELDTALMIYRAAINHYDSDTRLMDNGEKPKIWISDCAKANPYFCSESVSERIGIVANWQKDAGRPKGSKNR